MGGKLMVLEILEPDDRIEVRDPGSLHIEICRTRCPEDPCDFIHFDKCRHIARDKVVLVCLNGNIRVELETDRCDECRNKENRDRVFRDLDRGIGEELAIGPALLLWRREGIAGLLADCITDLGYLRLGLVADDVGNGRYSYERDAVTAHYTDYCYQPE